MGSEMQLGVMRAQKREFQKSQLVYMLSYWDVRQPKKYGEKFRKYKFMCPFMTPKMILFAHSVTYSYSALESDINLQKTKIIQQSSETSFFLIDK
jgi:hypothetical protein